MTLKKHTFIFKIFSIYYYIIFTIFLKCFTKKLKNLYDRFNKVLEQKYIYIYNDFNMVVSYDDHENSPELGAPLI